MDLSRSRAPIARIVWRRNELSLFVRYENGIPDAYYSINVPNRQVDAQCWTTHRCFNKLGVDDATISGNSFESLDI